MVDNILKQSTFKRGPKMQSKQKKIDNKVRVTIDKATQPLQKFFKLEASSGIFLFLTAILAMIFANTSYLQDLYFGLIKMPIIFGIADFTLNKNLLLLVNDGLMAIFFFLVGLEIKRELMVGELSTPRKAAFSLFAALGGMLFPALLFLSLNAGTEFQSGWGIAMATDIAFALGILTLLGKRVSPNLKIFLLALAIVDDLGAILIIALFYSGEIAANYLGVAAIMLFLLFVLNYAGFRNIAIGIIIGVVVWFCFLKSGVHATIAGVLLAFLTPAKSVKSSNQQSDKDNEGELLIDKYIHGLHPWVAFFIMPVFAFFNAGVNLSGVNLIEILQHPVPLGIIFGLVVGKPVGIFLLTFISTKLGWTELPKNTTWLQIIAVGFVAGIGFTMSLFINSLAFGGQEVETFAKAGIIFASLFAMVIGYALLYFGTSKKR